MRPSVTAAALALAACGPAVGVGTAQTAAPSPPDSSRAAPAPADSAPAWLVADPAAKTATLALQVTHRPDGASLLNGHRQGELQIVVPLGWTVQWDWRNADSTAAHSLVVMVEREKLPTEGGRAAFTNAMTRAVTTGLPAGQGDRTTFTADEAGWYWLLCGVASHAIGGEYLGLRVDPEAKTAVVRRK
ncbi:MAG TPA: sulfocyanin-like copper-binding protein [Gemmatimonadales bacterium]|nr:sulfocyanin-like copper-binding protein [Gemmatimonadales bacterium]